MCALKNILNAKDIYFHKCFQYRNRDFTIHFFNGVADSQFHLDVSLGRVDGFKACNLWEPEELHHKSERDAHPALLRGWCLEEGRSAPKVNAMAGIALRLGPCGTGGSQVIKEDRTSAHSETM
ncbi:uncharacterized protein LOC115317205 [Ixodes scapularis]|uniref:uncharacterized protein LOC115317205 n=1 Tax=Ixodes scapularis TaxID=6945 RepID=UPI001A9D8AED|nr:uncharacterized protein LOC115317205 [Ixodes scapularis]